MGRQVEEIIQNISKMSDEDILERIKEIRRTRNTKPAASTKSKDRPANKSKGKDTLVSLLAGMSIEERDAMIKKLQKGKSNA